MSKCATCKHLKQNAPLDFSIYGSCNWKIPVPLPQWLSDYVESTDLYYGPNRDVGRRYSGNEVKSCDAFEEAAEDVIEKRKSETWYEENV